MQGEKALFSSKKMNWGTPYNVFTPLQQEFHFKTDAAASRENRKCENYWTEAENALIQEWTKETGPIFLNPPYGRQIGKWVRKAYESHAQYGTTIVMLIPARTDTSYFHDYIYGKAEIRFIRGRVKFLGDDGFPHDAAPFPSMIVIYKKEENKC